MNSDLNHNVIFRLMIVVFASSVSRQQTARFQPSLDGSLPPRALS